ncbi:MAG TPA: hypothetical protein VE954_05245 [Oligoflexus sp.]|uniref:hypothetical protein n=1 Tax=Oligoflexus sp. TaxID=1971216 RepID=UPI002D426D8A|nr:hypothetical protein [Oligoflexus sp.]HYX32498.1 hypothetical protein [Oligoflexus sp.]
MSFRNHLAVLALFLGSQAAFGQSHSLVDRNRSSETANVFLFQSVDGEFGKVEKSYKNQPEAVTQTWRGYGIRNGVGIELFKFTQFSFSHTLLNLRSRDTSLENMRGSKLSGEITFAFSAPITNIQFGLGVIASQMDYQNFEKSGAYVGTGHYYNMGFNYFVSQMFSLQFIGKHSTIRHTASGGSLDLQEINSSTDSLSFGLAIWI